MYFFVRKLLSLSISISLCLGSRSQSLYTGDTWPNLHFNEVLNYPKTSLELRDFQGKFLLIDVWANSCLSCIEHFPRLDSLQAQFKDRLQIIMINPEDKDSTLRFFKRMKKLYVPKNIPMVTGEKALFKQLRTLGHLWLDSSLILKYNGDSYHTTAENIRKFIAGIPLTFKQRRLVADLNPNVPLIAEGEGRWLDSVNFYSYLFHHAFSIPGLRASLPGKNGPPNRLCMPNISVLGLYNAAYNNGVTDWYTIMPMEIRVKDSSLFFPPTGDKADENWKINHEYTYDVKVPLSRSGSIYTVMQRDLEMHFGLKAGVQIIEKECWALEPLDKKLFISTGGKAYTNMGNPYKDSINRYKHWPANEIFLDIKLFFQRYSSLPVVNQLSYSGAMNFEIHQNVILEGSMEAFLEALRKNGLTLRKTRAKIPVLVITD